MTSRVNDALDEIWRASTERRPEVAEREAARLTKADAQMLRTWGDFAAAKARGVAGEVIISPTGSVPADAAGTSTANLLIVAQYARDHLGSLMVALHESRQRDVAEQAKRLNLEVEELWTLLETSATVLGGRG